MERRDFVIHSSCLNKDMRIIQYGTSGVPFVGFPSQCGGAGNYEEFGIIRTLSPYLDAGRMQLFCVDSVDHESWYCEQGINTWRSARQEDYYRHITEEVLPIVQENSPSGKKPVVMGIDMGATHAAIVFFRRPELFSGMLALSGIYGSTTPPIIITDGWTARSMTIPSSAFFPICRMIIPGSANTTTAL